MDVTKAKDNWTGRLDKKVKNGSINEKKMIIQRLENFLDIIKGVELPTSEDSLNLIKKPLEELETSLKYIPNGPFFNDIFPAEIKECILDYLCDDSAFVAAAVCNDWKKASEKRFEDQDVMIEKCYECDNFNDCVKPVDMLKAAATHKLDVSLSIREPLTDIDPEIIADALTSVSKISIETFKVNNFDFETWSVINEDFEAEYDIPTLSNDQLECLFDRIEKGRIIEDVKLKDVDLTGLNQETLSNCLVNKVKRLTLTQKYLGVNMDSGTDEWRSILDVETFASKLQQYSGNLELTHLTLNDFDLSTNLSSVLGNVENVKLSGHIPYDSPTMKRLAKTLLQAPFIMKTLIIDTEEDYDLGSFINPQDLQTVCRRMETLELGGYLTSEQLQAIRCLPDVTLEQQYYRLNDSNETEYYWIIKKGSTEIF